MYDQFSEQLNTLLLDTFYEIQKLEEKALKKTGKGDLSISEFHMLESIGKGEEGRKTVGDIASSLSVTLPTVTVAVNRLEKKGYITKTKSAEDGRVVYIGLTREGRKMDRIHQFYHRQMLKSIQSEFNGEEIGYLLRCIRKLNQFFKDSNHDR